jgi:two-component system sporulation sensor kinase A
MIPLSPDICAQSLDSNIISQFIHKIGNHFQLINLLIGSLKRNGVSKDEIDVLQETVDRAVEFTRSFSHYTQAPVYLPAVDFGEFIRSVMHSNALLFAEKRIELKAILDKCIDGTHVSADPFLLELAVTAVLREALDASNAGDQVVIEVKIEVTVPIGSIVRMSVVYNSCEMEAGILGEASAPFLTSKPEKDGLGLSMAIRLIEAHGGLLNISTDANRGTRMEIVLPLCDAVKPSER